MYGPLSIVTDRLGWLRSEMDQLLNDYLPGWEYPRAAGSTYPPVNLWEDESAYHLEAELPGLKVEDLELSARGEEFTIKGERRFEPKKEWIGHRQERPFGRFARTLVFGVPLDADKVQASFKDGVLSVTLPKAEAAKPRRIEIKRIENKPSVTKEGGA